MKYQLCYTQIAHKCIRLGCDTIKSVTDIALSWPDISFIVDGIQVVFDILEPILDFFDDLQAALDAELCMENPFKLPAE